MSNRRNRQRILTNQITRLTARIKRLEAAGLRLSNWRLTAFVAGCGASIASYYWLTGWLTGIIIVASIIAFGVAVHFHRRVEKSLNDHLIWQTIRQTHLARMNLDWAAIPESQAEPVNDPNHPFETDLDITGPQSMLHLLDTAVSREGSERLRDWLLQRIPSYHTTIKRQILIRELSLLPTFRDRLTLALTEAADGRFSSNTLLAWLNRPVENFKTPLILGKKYICLMARLLRLEFFALNVAQK